MPRIIAMSGPVRIAVAIGLAAMAAGSVLAQVPRGGGESQKIMQEYQRLAGERTALQAQAAQLKKDLDAARMELLAVKKERDALKSHVTGAAGVVAQAVGAKQGAEKNLEQAKQRMTELVARFRETAQNLKDVETDRTKARTELSTRNTAYDTCAENNLRLYEINGAVLDRYEHVGLFTRTAAAEPFTKITRTRIENLVDEYRVRAQELRLKKPPSP